MIDTIVTIWLSLPYWKLSKWQILLEPVVKIAFSDKIKEPLFFKYIVSVLEILCKEQYQLDDSTALPTSEVTPITIS